MRQKRHYGPLKGLLKTAGILALTGTVFVLPTLIGVGKAFAGDAAAVKDVGGASRPVAMPYGDGLDGERERGSSNVLAEGRKTIPEPLPPPTMDEVVETGKQLGWFLGDLAIQSALIALTPGVGNVAAAILTNLPSAVYEHGRSQGLTQGDPDHELLDYPGKAANIDALSEKKQPARPRVGQASIKKGAAKELNS